MKVSYIELLGQKHPLCMSLAAAEELTEEFGDLSKMADELDGKNLSKMARAVDRILTILLKAGRIYAGALGEKLPPELPCRPADLIDVRDQAAVQAIFSAMRADTERTVEVEGKNAEATSGR